MIFEANIVLLLIKKKKKLFQPGMWYQIQKGVYSRCKHDAVDRAFLQNLE